MVSLTIVIMLYIHHIPELTHLITGSLYPLLLAINSLFFGSF